MRTPLRHFPSCNGGDLILHLLGDLERFSAEPHQHHPANHLSSVLLEDAPAKAPADLNRGPDAPQRRSACLPRWATTSCLSMTRRFRIQPTERDRDTRRSPCG